MLKARHIAGCLLSLLAAAVASAHHSFAQFDMEKTITLAGTVKEFQWVNPERFDLSEWSRARVNIDYHIPLEENYYSVPYNLVHETVEVRSTPMTIEIFHKSQRVASHLRAYGHGHAVTIVEHRSRSNHRWS